MPIQIQLKRQGLGNNYNTDGAMRAFAQQFGRLKANGVAALTNNGGGTAGVLQWITPDLVNTANSGTSLAQKAATEAALNLVKDALLEIMTQAGLMVNAIGLNPVLTYNGGGTTADGTIGAITVSVTAATTGVLATNTNSMITALNAATYIAAQYVNKICKATGNTGITTNGFAGKITYPQTIPAITIDGGTAADPGVTKVAMDAKLVIMQNNIKTIADKLVSIRSTTALLVVAD